MLGASNGIAFPRELLHWPGFFLLITSLITTMKSVDSKSLFLDWPFWGEANGGFLVGIYCNGGQTSRWLWEGAKTSVSLK